MQEHSILQFYVMKRPVVDLNHSVTWCGYQLNESVIWNVSETENVSKSVTV